MSKKTLKFIQMLQRPCIKIKTAWKYFSTILHRTCILRKFDFNVKTNKKIFLLNTSKKSKTKQKRQFRMDLVFWILLA